MYITLWYGPHVLYVCDGCCFESVCMCEEILLCDQRLLVANLML